MKKLTAAFLLCVRHARQWPMNFNPAQDRPVTRQLELIEAEGSRFRTCLQRAGLPPIQEEFSVVPAAQTICRETIEEIEAFIRVFDSVTMRASWVDRMRRELPPVDQKRREVCFFSAWDFHIPPGSPKCWQLIEFNDNGSGFMFAASINRCFYESAGLEVDRSIEAVPRLSEFGHRLLKMVEQEARGFHGDIPNGLFLILDDTESLEAGKFRREHLLLSELFRQWGRSSEIGAPEDLRWTGEELLYRGTPVSFIINRSTDFLWERDTFAPLRLAHRRGNVYVCPNPYTYATRSDKRLLQALSQPLWDKELGITAEERAILSAHVPETHVITERNVNELVDRKDEFVFKPMHGFAGRGLLASDTVGRQRLRRLLRKGQAYVAQRKVPKSETTTPGTEKRQLWTDLRVWAYRGERFLLSGRASTRPDRLELGAPGGWLPTFVRG
jgi:hypothetical protein